MDINKFQGKHLKTVARNTPVFVTLVDKSKYRNLICTLFMLRRVTNMHSAEYGIAFLFNVYTLFINITFLRFHRFCLDVFFAFIPGYSVDRDTVCPNKVRNVSWSFAAEAGNDSWWWARCGCDVTRRCIARRRQRSSDS